MAAMDSYNPKATLMLLDAGAEANSYGGELHYPVQCAARHSTAALRIILNKGADLMLSEGDVERRCMQQLTRTIPSA